MQLWKGSEYSSIPSRSGFWISRFTQGLPIFVNMIGFWIYVRMQLWKGSEYCRFPSMPGFWISRFSQGLPIFVNMIGVLNIRPDAVMEGLWIFQVSKYTKFLHMQVLHKVLNMPEYGWIIPEKKLFWLWQSSAFALSKFHRVLNMPLVLNMPGLRLWQIVNMRGLHRVLNIPEYTWICLNNASKCLNMP